MQRHDTRAIASPSGSITKLGIVRFVLSSEEPHASERPRPGGVVELPSFSSEERPRPTVQMPSLGERRERPAPRPVSDAVNARPRGGMSSQSGITAWMLR